MRVLRSLYWTGQHMLAEHFLNTNQFINHTNFNKIFYELFNYDLKKY